MSNIIDNIVIGSIVILYNLLVHNFTSYSYKELQYDDKVKKTVTMLFFFGIIAYIIAKFVLDDDKNKFKNSILSKGLKIGGALLMITALFVNWENMQEEFKIGTIGIIFAFLIYYSYKNHPEKIEN
jgi:hypothetical protein